MGDNAIGGLGFDHETLDHLRDEGLVDVVELGDDERGATLTKYGQDLLDSHLMDRGDEPSQAFYAGVSRSLGRWTFLAPIGYIARPEQP